MAPRGHRASSPRLAPGRNCGQCASRAGVARLLGFLSHFGDHRIAGDGGEEAVDVDRRKTLGKGDVLLWGEILVSKEDDTVLPEGAADLGERVGGNGSHEIDAAYFGADMR